MICPSDPQKEPGFDETAATVLGRCSRPKRQVNLCMHSCLDGPATVKHQLA
jgi:hypothetical protein